MNPVRILSLLVLPIALSACIDFEDDDASSDSTPTDKPAVELTETSIDEAIEIRGAGALTQPVVLPDAPATVTAANVDTVVVSANSSFSLTLSVDETDVPSGKKVGGYLIELPTGDQFLAVANGEAGERAAIESRSQMAKSAFEKRKAEKELNPVARSLPLLRAVNTVANTEVTINGWSGEEFILDASIEGLKLRIWPLLVNETVDAIATIADFDLEDASTWLGAQELALAVVAVASSPVQVTLTWDALTDLDIWVVEPNENKIYFANTFSSSSLGWLDFDNVRGFGPENITFTYQLPIGEYKVYVHHYDGGVATNYQVTVAVNDSVNRYSGDFPESASGSDTIGGDSVDLVASFIIDQSVNTQLSAPVAASAFYGVWALPGTDPERSFIEISETGFDIYSYDTFGEEGCLGGTFLEADYLPTGMRVSDGALQVSGAFFAGLTYDQDIEFSYEFKTLEAYTKPEECTLNDEFFE